jgi:hypothetical protein
VSGTRKGYRVKVSFLGSPIQHTDRGALIYAHSEEQAIEKFKEEWEQEIHSWIKYIAEEYEE